MGPMSERPSMWSQRVRMEWLKTAMCPACFESNGGTRSNLIELTETGAWCGCCSHEWVPERAPVEVVK